MFESKLAPKAALQGVRCQPPSSKEGAVRRAGLKGNGFANESIEAWADGQDADWPQRGLGMGSVKTMRL